MILLLRCRELLLQYPELTLQLGNPLVLQVTLRTRFDASSALEWKVRKNNGANPTTCATATLTPRGPETGHAPLPPPLFEKLLLLQLSPRSYICRCIIGRRSEFALCGARILAMRDINRPSSSSEIRSCAYRFILYVVRLPLSLASPVRPRQSPKKVSRLTRQRQGPTPRAVARREDVRLLERALVARAASALEHRVQLGGGIPRSVMLLQRDAQAVPALEHRV